MSILSGIVTIYIYNTKIVGIILHHTFQCTTTERGKYSSRDITPDMLCAGGDAVIGSV